MSEFKKMNDPGNADFEEFLRSQSLDLPDSVRDAVLFQCGIARGTAAKRRASSVRIWKVSALVLAAFVAGGLGGIQLQTTNESNRNLIVQPTPSTDTHVADKTPVDVDRVRPRENRPKVVAVNRRPKGLHVGSTDIDTEPVVPLSDMKRSDLTPASDVLRVGHSRQILDWL